MRDGEPEDGLDLTNGGRADQHYRRGVGEGDEEGAVT